MAIVLGKNPKHFTRDVSLVNMDNETDTIKITYIYRTRKQFAELLDQRADAEEMVRAQEEQKAKVAAEAAEAAEAKGEKIPVVRASAAATFKQAATEAAGRVLEVASGWDLSDPFTVENLLQLEDDFPGALGDIQDKYQAAVLEVRRKN